MELLGVKFAPLRVPLERRLQTLAAGAWFCVLGFGSFIGWMITFYCLVFGQWLRYLTLVYLYWVFYLDWNTYKRGGRSDRWISWMRNSSWWRYFCAYFPVKLVKTVDLDPSRNYLLCSFPHGILATGAFAAFSTDILNCKNVFPGLEPRIVTLDQHFKIPFFREFVYSFGACGACSESLEYLLQPKSQNEKSTAVVLVVGGAAESLKCRPSTYDIILKKRKGFVKIALKTGTPLVPVFSFGETDLYDQIRSTEDSFLNKVQEFIRKICGIAPVIVVGRGFFQYTFGLIPQRKPVTVVVGEPLELPKILKPSQEEIDEYHQKFTEKLIELFETEKHKYLENPEKIKLSIY
ncbi:2-acylglycerol O-acyltransferase 2-A [Diachasma alloeum]|uniref:2-acylglycerol O-acyltransferase 2-A n=1 Tax=Diachasma alloeum TaxID=454923 RepID=UPI0007384146|nr:2-acylglycerol O-acyltransferase 2-A [Diachasma alloeum]XP_015121848.1 2-acylglycerol O-acyltransferase 2-A [Diachasma alloeum]